MAYSNIGGFRPDRWQQRWQGGIETQTLSDDITLDGRSANMLRLDPDNAGSSRNVNLPAEEDSEGLMFWISNASSVAFEDLVLRDDSPATIVTIEPGEAALVACDGAAWLVMDHSSGQSVIDALSAAAPFVVTRNFTTADLTASAGTQVFSFLEEIPTKALVVARGLNVTTEFSGGGSAAVSVDWGDAGDADGWFDGENVFTASGTGARTVPSTPGARLLDQAADMVVGARAPRLTFIADVDVDLLAAGDLDAWVAYIAVPLGAAIPG